MPAVAPYALQRCLQAMRDLFKNGPMANSSILRQHVLCYLHIFVQVQGSTTICKLSLPVNGTVQQRQQRSQCQAGTTEVRVWSQDSPLVSQGSVVAPSGRTLLKWLVHELNAERQIELAIQHWCWIDVIL